jgi:hypothetical protein
VTGLLRKFLTLSASIVIVGCAPVQPICATDNGTWIMGYLDRTPLEVPCGRFNAIERKLSAYMKISNLAGYQVWLRSTESFIDPWNRDVGGYTQCPLREIVIGTGKTVYAHEAIHAITNCVAEPPVDMGADADHADWFRSGYFEIIDRVSE